MLEEQDPSLKFCFFIDGLDEFKGDLEALITLTKRISLYGNTKICVSSRPLIIFEDAFRTKPQLMLQDLTHADIRKYVEHNLTDNPGFTELRNMDEKYADGLMNNVAEKSDGVFLWVVLVVRSLLEGLRDGDHLLDLQKRLDDLPEELDDLFRRILHNFDTRYFRDASILFQLFKAWDGRLSLLSLALAEQANEGLAIQAEMIPMSSSEKFYKALKMRRQLDSRCKGLLEVEPIRRKISETEERIVRDLSELKPEEGEQLAKSRVDFLHRTVSDFLDRPDIWAKFTASTENNSRPYAAFAQSWLLQLKWVYSDYAITRASPLWNAIFGVLEYAEKSESQEMLSQTRLLDELDESATFLISQRRGSDGLTILERDWKDPSFHWTTTNTSFHFGHSSLDLAVQCGLAKYIDDKLTIQPPANARLWSLLLSAGENFDIKYFRNGGSAFHRSKPNIEVIRVLLDHLNLPEAEKSDLLQNAKAVSNAEAAKLAFLQRVKEVCDSQTAFNNHNDHNDHNVGLQFPRVNRFRTLGSAPDTDSTEGNPRISTNNTLKAVEEAASLTTKPLLTLEAPCLQQRNPLWNLMHWRKKRA